MNKNAKYKLRKTLTGFGSVMVGTVFMMSSNQVLAQEIEEPIVTEETQELEDVNTYSEFTEEPSPVEEIEDGQEKVLSADEKDLNVSDTQLEEVQDHEEESLEFEDQAELIEESPELELEAATSEPDLEAVGVSSRQAAKQLEVAEPAAATPAAAATAASIQTLSAGAEQAPSYNLQEDLNHLSQSITAEMEKSDSGWQISLRGLSQPEISLDVSNRDHKPQSTASTMKLFILSTAIEQLENGTANFTLDEVQNDLEQMIHISDNDATDRMIDRVGGFDPINDHIRRVTGAETTKIEGYIGKGTPNVSNPWNRGTSQDFATWMVQFNEGQLMNQAHSNLARQWMTGASGGNRFVKGANRAGAESFHKSGENYDSNRVANDIATIIDGDLSFVLSGFSWLGNYNTQISSLANVGALTTRAYRDMVKKLNEQVEAEQRIAQELEELKEQELERLAREEAERLAQEQAEKESSNGADDSLLESPSEDEEAKETAIDEKEILTSTEDEEVQETPRDGEVKQTPTEDEESRETSTDEEKVPTSIEDEISEDRPVGEEEVPTSTETKESEEKLIDEKEIPTSTEDEESKETPTDEEEAPTLTEGKEAKETIIETEKPREKAIHVEGQQAESDSQQDTDTKDMQDKVELTKTVVEKQVKAMQKTKETAVDRQEKSTQIPVDKQVDFKNQVPVASPANHVQAQESFEPVQTTNQLAQAPSPSNKRGEKLPDTATSLGAVGLLGLASMALGIGAGTLNKKRRK